MKKVRYPGGDISTKRRASASILNHSIRVSPRLETNLKLITYLTY